jgi:uncharacterized lipoprotein YmbA
VTNVSLVLLSNLREQVGGHHVVTYPSDGNANVDYQIEVRFLRFEPTTEGESHLDARWTIRDLRRNRLVIARHTNHVRFARPEDTPAVVAALSATLADLSRDIATVARAVARARSTRASEPTRKR